MTQPRVHGEYLPYHFNTEELRQIALNLARSSNHLQDIATEKKRAAASFKEREEATNAEIRTLSACIREGYEMRMIECQTEFDKPGKGMKSIIRIDTGEVVREERMSESERQYALELNSATSPVVDAEPKAKEPEAQETVPPADDPPEWVTRHGLGKQATAEAPTTKRRGRPRGSKNRPKTTEAPEDQPAAESASSEPEPQTDDDSEAFPGVGPIPHDPNGPEWRTPDEIFAGVPRFIKV